MPTGNDGVSHFVSGTVALDAAELPELAGTEKGDVLVRAVVLHEVGHLAGLAHIDQETQLLFPTVSTVSQVTIYQAGDLAGLAQLGQGPCALSL